MKKLFLSFIATTMISTFSFANTNEITEINSIETNEIVLSDFTEKTEVDAWFCYEIRRTTRIDMMTGDEITTITYKCTWYHL